jgi:hypothetical protein
LEFPAHQLDIPADYNPILDFYCCNSAVELLGVNSNNLEQLCHVSEVACPVLPRKEDKTLFFHNQPLEKIKFPGVKVPNPRKACSTSSTYANVVPMQLLDQEATTKFYATSNRIRESSCENPVCIFDIIGI